MAKKSRKAAQISIDINANVAQLARDMAKVTGQLDGFKKQLRSVSTVMKASFALDVARTFAPAVQSMVSALSTLASKGEDAGSVADAFARLGGNSGELVKAKQSVLGLVDSFDLMKIANQGLLRELPGFADNFSQIAALGASVADTLQMDTAAGIQMVTDALSSGKKKQLEAIGLTVDADKAYKEYAKTIGSAATKLSDAQKLEAVRLAAIRQLPSALEKVGTITDSLANSQTAVNVAWAEGIKQIGIGINQNAELAAGYRALADELNKIDWQGLGQGAGEFFAILGSAARDVLPSVTNFVKDFTTGMQYMFGETVSAERLRSGSKIAGLQEARDRVEGQWWRGAGKETQVAKIDAEIAAEKARFLELTNIIERQSAASKTAQTQTGELAAQHAKGSSSLKEYIKYTDLSNDALEYQAKVAEEAQKKIDRWNAKWAEQMSRRAETDARKGFDDPDKLTPAAFDALKLKMEQVVRQGFTDEWSQAVKDGAKNLDEVEQEGRRIVRDISDDLETQFRDSFRGATDQFSRSVTDIAGNFGLELDSVMSTASRFFGDDMNGAMLEFAKSVGMTSKELEATFQTIGTIANAALNARKQDKATSSNQGTGGLLGAILGALIGGNLAGPQGAAVGAEGGSAIGSFAGKYLGWGSQNKETNARHSFANWMEDQLSSRGSFSMFGSNGQMITGAGSSFNFVEGGKDRFNNPGWADSMNRSGGQTGTMFSGLGNSMKELLGITEEVGSQISFLLAENLAGNIDNARLMVYQLGLSLQDMEKALLSAAQKGSISWREYTVQIAAMGEAFKPGLSGVADLAGAMEQLIGSGGRGLAAIKAVKDIATEAIEAGVSDIEKLREALLGKGVSAENADTFIQALRDNGIKTVEEIQNLTDQQLGAIVSSMEGASNSIASKWKEIADNLRDVKIEMDKLPDEKNIKVKFSAEFDANMQKAMDAGLVNIPRGNTGATSSPNVSSSYISSSQSSAAARSVSSQRLAVGGMSISIDARGAEVGVEQRILSVMNSYKTEIAAQAASMVYDSQSRR